MTRKISKHGSTNKLLDQKEIIDALRKTSAYEPNSGKIKLIQTHISFVFLTDKFVYKVKKAVNFGFLDFGSLEKRKKFCEKEFEINKKLCEDMYLKVVPITKSELIKINGKGKTVEYAVMMKRIPQKYLMNKLLEENKINKKIIDQIAKIIADFHLKIEEKSDAGNLGYNPKIDPIAEVNWKENFDQTQLFIEKTISQKNFVLIQDRINEFIEKNKDLFKKRIINGKVRYCHGDIHSGNIFITNKIYIFDAIEFNDRIRYSDVTADIGFLAMDLEFKNKFVLAEYLVKKYIEYSGDKESKKLLPFYKCYRAYVRGKVVSFKLEDIHIDIKEKEKASIEAKAYFELATKYAKIL